MSFSRSKREGVINYEAFCRTSQEKQFIKGCIDPGKRGGGGLKGSRRLLI